MPEILTNPREYAFSARLNQLTAPLVVKSALIRPGWDGSSLTRELLLQKKKSSLETPPDALAIMQESVLDLSRSGILGRSVKRGELAPDFSLLNSRGTSVHLTDLLTRGPVVLSFYRGNWCPFCSIELQALQNALPRITELGATLVAVSPQTIPCSEGAGGDWAPGYEVLTDNGNKVARSYGIVFHLQDEMQAIYKEFGLELPEYNGDDSFDLPVPATYVIGVDGVVNLAFVDPDYTRRLDPAEILTSLRRLRVAA